MKRDKNRSSSLRTKFWMSFTIVIIVTLSVAWVLIGNLESTMMDLSTMASISKNVPASAETLSTHPAEAVQRFRVIVLFSMAVIILSLAVAGIYLSRTVLQPIEKTTIAAKQIASGRLDNIIPIQSHDEIGDLGEQINDIAMNAQEVLLYMWNMSDQLNEFLTNASKSLNSGRREISPEIVLEHIADAASALREMRGAIEAFGLYGVKIDKEKVLESDHAD